MINSICTGFFVTSFLCSLKLKRCLRKEMSMAELYRYNNTLLNQCSLVVTLNCNVSIPPGTIVTYVCMSAVRLLMSLVKVLYSSKVWIPDVTKTPQIYIEFLRH